MFKAISLTQSTLSSLSPEIKIPAYDRSKIRAGIVHVGIGGFHRAHQAYYTDQLFTHYGESDWGICGIALLENDRKIYDTLVNQDGLYTLMVTDPTGTASARVIGSIVEYIFAPDDPIQVIEKMADPDVKIITLTITEGGYNFDASTGEFQPGNPAIQWDARHPEQPRTIFGYLTQALKLRRDRNLKGLTIQSCDNIQHNGDVARKMFIEYLSLAEPELRTWVNDQVSFPNSMVDRITPLTSAADIERLQQKFGLSDAWPVVCEPFCQWVIEDKFVNGRPDWDLVGAQFVDDVDPYEKMKIRLVNGGHVSLGFTGYLNGYQYVYETVQDPVYFNFIRGFLDEEATDILDEVPGIDIGNYKSILMERFGNPNIKDQLTRIFSESSAKVPKFLLSTVNDQLEKGGPIKKSVLIIASWCRYLEMALESGQEDQVQDNMCSILLEKAKQSSEGNELAFLAIPQIFGDLSSNERFITAYLKVIKDLRKHGIKKMISELDKAK